MWDRTIGTFQKSEEFSLGEYSIYYTYTVNGINYRDCFDISPDPTPKNIEEVILYNPSRPSKSMLLSKNYGVIEMIIAVVCCIIPIILMIVVSKKKGKEYLADSLSRNY